LEKYILSSNQPIKLYRKIRNFLNTLKTNIFPIGVFLFYCGMYFPLLSQDINSFKEEKALSIESEAIYELAKYVSIFEDKSAILNFEQVQQKEFKPNSKGTINFGFSESAYWFKFKLKNTTQIKIEDWFFVLEFPQLDSVKFFYPVKNGSTLEKSGGDLLPFKEREIKIRFLNFPIPSDLDLDRDIYIRVQSLSTMIVPVSLSTKRLILERDHFLQISSGIYLGILIILILYNAFLFISLKEKVFLYYILFTSFVLIYMTSFLGFGYEYFWSESPYIQSKCILISSLPMFVFLLLFSLKFLETRIYFPRVDKYLRLFLYVFAALFIYFMISDAIVRTKITSTIAFGFSIIFPTLAILSKKKGLKIARLYLVGWIPFFIAINMFILRLLGVIEQYGLEIIYLLQVSNILEAVIFSFALADRVNILKEEVQFNLEKSNRELEQNVIDRTVELSSALKLIKSDMNTAKKIQQNILNENYAKFKNLDIIVSYIPLDEVGGDMYKIHELENGKIRIFIADATGHGVQGALMAMSIYSEFENIKDYLSSPADIMTILNTKYYDRYVALNVFFTCIILDIDLQKNSVQYSFAGHPDQIRILNGEVSQFNIKGKLIGLIRDHQFSNSEFQFNKGDRLVLFTDGIFEQFHPDHGEYGEDRFFENVQFQKSYPLKDFTQNLINSLSDFLNGNKKQDDITLLAIERK
jgi:two-component system, sensor histidine kinase LadS